MAIVTIDGRPRSVRTNEERASLLADDIERLPDYEREALQALFLDLVKGDVSGYRQLVETEYDVVPVGPREFLTNPYFLGETGASLWPKLADDVVELFEGEYQEAIFSGSLGWGKCLEKDSFFVDGITGRRCVIQEAVDKTPLVPSLDKSISHRLAAKVWLSGRKQCAKLLLASGQWLRASLDHPILCPQGYRPLGELQPKDLVAVARRVPSPLLGPDVTDEEVLLVGALLADGGMTGGNCIYTKSQVLCDRVVRAAHSVTHNGFSIAVEKMDFRSIRLLGLQPWAEAHGLMGVLSKNKRVPDDFFGLKDHQLAILLRWVFTDGNVYSGSPRKIEICLASEGLIDDLQYLLRRFGIVARKSYRPKKNNEGVFDAWRLQIADAPTQIAFLEKVGFIPGKESACQKVLDQARAILSRSNSNWDVVPITNVELKEIRRETGPHNNKVWNKLAGQADSSFMGRERFKRLCEVTGYQGRYRRYADMDDIVWERVESIEGTGEQDVYDLSVPSTENAVINGIVVHNSFMATTVLSYVVYQMSCLKSPQRAYGIDPGSHLYLAMLSLTERVAKNVVVKELLGKITHSPYFKEKFPFKAAPSNLEIRFPKAIQIVGGSTSSSAIIGLNVFSGFIDEASFFGEIKKMDRQGKIVAIDQGQSIYKSITRRMKSRFQRVGRLPGLLILASSKENPNAFIEKRIVQAQETNDPYVFVREYATWDVRPREHFSEKNFDVVVGNDRVASRILTGEPEERQRYADLGLKIVSVPEDYRLDFEADIDGSLRDIGGVATQAISNFMNRTEKVVDLVDASLVNPIGDENDTEPQEEWVANRPLNIRWGAIAEPYERRLPGGFREQSWRPKRHPQAVRYAHIDPSLTGDASGICIAHIAGWTEVVRRDYHGEEYVELAPRIEADLVLGVVPPPGDEIMLSDIRAVIYQFIEHGFPIAYVSLDSFQSVDSIQQMKKRGIDAEVVSVDRTTDPYDVLKTTTYEDRLRIYPHRKATDEIRLLQRVIRPGGRVKVDHPKKNPDGSVGSKDVADAICGVVYSLTRKLPGRPMAMMASPRTEREQQQDMTWALDGNLIPVENNNVQTKRPNPGNMGAKRINDIVKSRAMPFMKG
jgi:hypothetical protein